MVFPTSSYQRVRDTSDSRMYQFGMIGLLVAVKGYSTDEIGWDP